jgi:hypothetical protein
MKVSDEIIFMKMVLCLDKCDFVHLSFHMTASALILTFLQHVDIINKTISRLGKLFWKTCDRLKSLRQRFTYGKLNLWDSIL